MATGKKRFSEGRQADRLAAEKAYRMEMDGYSGGDTYVKKAAAVGKARRAAAKKLPKPTPGYKSKSGKLGGLTQKQWEAKYGEDGGKKQPRKSRAKPKHGNALFTKAQLVKKATAYNNQVKIKAPSKMKKAALAQTLRDRMAM